MSRTSQLLAPPEPAYLRKALFAVEVLDGVTLSRLWQGVELVADGLHGKPIVNAGGLFVWLEDNVAAVQKVSVNPGALPYQAMELERAQLRLPPDPRPLTTIELAPRGDYPFVAGITGARGSLSEERVAAGQRVPVRGAEIRVQWLDDDGIAWRDAPLVFRTNDNGDFVVVLRLAASQVPKLDASGTVTARLRVTRDGLTQRTSPELKLPQGRVVDPSTLPALILAWDEL